MRRGSFVGVAGALVLATLVAGMPVQAATPVFTETKKLLALDGAGGDFFGRTVALSGDTAVIGAPFRDDKGSNSGAAYVFVRDSTGTWTQQAKLLALDGSPNDNFGTAVAISGDTAIIGAPGGADRDANSGAAYVFVRDSTGTWTQQAKLLASDRAEADALGTAVALSGDTAVIVALFGDGNVKDSGAAYVFARDSAGTWTQQAKLVPSDGAQFDLSGVVGTNVALSGDTALIGAPSHGDDPSLGSGAAYVFVRDSTGTWTQQAKLLALDRAEADALGTAVALSGDTAVIGALGRDDNGSGSGAAYVFVRDSTGTWTQHAKLLASDGIQNDLFGAAVALSGETALVGAFGVAQNSGAAYVFVHDPTTGVWSEQAKLQASDGAPFDDFGIAVALSGETALVGALAGAAISGASYVFEFSGTTVDLLDPVPDLLAELTQTPEQAKAILARAGATVRGVAADGVARVVVRVSVPDLGTVELTLVDDAGIPLARPEEAGFLTQLGGAVGSNSLLVPTVGVPGKGSMAFAVYHAPSNFVRAGSGDANERDRQVSLRLRFAPQVGGASQEAMTSITIARPPVVLVHGLWGSDLSWDGFSPLITDPRFVVRRVNYRMNAAGLSVNAPDVGRQTRSLIRDYKADKRVAAVQADVVTHSMGGLLVRTLPLLGTAFFRNDNFQEGDVHKLINIGTPHTGSELALKLRTKKGRPLCRAMFRSFNVPIDEGAIDDLIPGSERLEALNSFASPIRMHNNAGLASALQKEVNATGMLISALQSPLVCGRILPRGGFDALFKDANDLLVSATSQRARLSPTSPAVSTFTPLIHTRAGGFFDVADGAAELEAEAVSLAVIELLHLPRRDPKFIRLSP